MATPAHRVPDNSSISLATLALTTGIVPFVTAHLSYFVSARAGFIPVCLTYLTGCTSVSASGRHGWSFFLYKGGMIVSAVLLALYWVLARRWLLSLGGRDAVALRAAVVLGLTSAAFYVVYALFVGVPGEVEVVLRRTGAAVHLGFAALAQLLAMGELLRLPADGVARIPAGIRRLKLFCVIVLLGLTVLIVPIEYLVENKNRGQNVIEWHFTTVMVAWYVLSGLAWRTSGYRAVLVTGDTGA